MKMINNLKEKNEKAITLIALVITIIVLLILAGVTIAVLTGDNGLLSKATSAREETKRAEALEYMKTKIIEVQAQKSGDAKLNDFVELLKNDANAEYTIALEKTSMIKGNLPDGIESAEKIYVKYSGYEFEVTNNFAITLVGGTQIINNNGGGTTGGKTTGGGTQTGATSRYIKVKISKTLLGSAQLDVDVPDSEEVTKVHFYMGNEEIHSGPETTYVVTGLEDGEDYEFYAIIDYNNKKISTNIKYQRLPTADIYVATTGSDVSGLGDGSADKPYATLSKAIDAATSGKTIYICPGTYILDPTYFKTNTQASGIYDMNKQLTIFGANERTILVYDASPVTTRDSSAVWFENSNTILRNLTYTFKPKSGSNYQKSIFGYYTKGLLKNVFLRISGANKASYSYGGTANFENCTIFCDLKSMDTSYSGSRTFKNMAMNTEIPDKTNTTQTNIQLQDFGESTDSLETIIQNSKNNAVFEANGVGVFNGDNAWE